MSNLSEAGWNLSEVAWSGGNKQLCEWGAEILAAPLRSNAQLLQIWKVVLNILWLQRKFHVIC